jgi:hypothetical protein
VKEGMVDLEKHWVGKYARTLLIDFHIPPEVSNLCSAFNAEKLAKDLVESNVNAVGIYTKCHYGFSYYNTKIGVRHPGLNFDYFGTLAKACKDAGLVVYAYYSVARDSVAYQNHPDWRQTDSKGHTFLLTKGNWGVVCFNSPYTQEVVFPQIREVLENYEVDGIWWDIVTFEKDSCFCPYCKKEMKAEGYDPYKPYEHYIFNEKSIERFYQESYSLIKSFDPKLQIVSNSTGDIGRARRCKDWLDALVTEYIPFRHGFLYWMPYGKHMRTMKQPFECCISSWHKAWGDFGNFKTLEQFKYEVAHALSIGGIILTVHQPFLDGNLSEDFISLLKEAYAFIKEREEWCIGSESVPYIAILADHATGESDDERHFNSLRGACKALDESHIQFDVIDEDEEFNKYKVLILPNNRTLSTTTIHRVREYVREGGRIIASHLTSLTKLENGKVDFALNDVFGVKYLGIFPESIGYMTSFHKDISKDLPKTPLIVYDQFVKVIPLEKTEVLAEVRRPLFEVKEGRSYSHAHAPPHPLPPTETACIVRNVYGKGRSIYIAPPIFRAYYEHNVPFYRILISNLLDLVLGREKLLEIKTGPSVSISLMSQENRWILHLVNYHAERRATLPLPTNYEDWSQPTPVPDPRQPYYRLPSHEVIEEIPPRYNIPIRIRLPKTPKDVYLAPSREKLTIEYKDNIAELIVPRLDVHQMIIFEFE